MTEGVVGIYLAAGSSKRMGENKLALPLGGASLGSRALQTALESDLAHVYVVTREGDLFNWMDSQFFQTPAFNKWTRVMSKDALKGQAHSIKDGLRVAIKGSDATGFMILLADQPFLSKETINNLIFRYTGTVLASRFEGIPRPPVIFPEKVIPELMKLEGDKGARFLLQNGTLDATMVDFSNAREFLDVDTKEVYELIKALF